MHSRYVLRHSSSLSYLLVVLLVLLPAAPVALHAVRRVGRHVRHQRGLEVHWGERKRGNGLSEPDKDEITAAS